jgi:hypothetical protein
MAGVLCAVTWAYDTPGRCEGCVGEEPEEDIVWVGEMGKVSIGALCRPYNLYN